MGSSALTETAEQSDRRQEGFEELCALESSGEEREARNL